jgi:hypothetical protein
VGWQNFPQDLYLLAQHLHLGLFCPATVNPPFAMPVNDCEVRDNFPIRYFTQRSYFAMLGEVTKLLAQIVFVRVRYEESNKRWRRL